MGVSAFVSIRARSLVIKSKNVNIIHLNGVDETWDLRNLPELTFLNFLQGNFFISDESATWFFLLFWNFFLFSCRLSDILPLQWTKSIFFSVNVLKGYPAGKKQFYPALARALGPQKA